MTRQVHRENSLRHPETVPAVSEGGPKTPPSAERCPAPCFRARTAVVCPEALEQVKRHMPVLRRTVGKLVSRKMVDTYRNENVFVNVEWRGNALGKHVGDVVVGVGAVVEQRAERPLPLLRLQGSMCVRNIVKKTFELDLPDAVELGTQHKCLVEKTLDDVGTLEETDFRVVIRPNLAAGCVELHPVGAVG